MSNGVGELFVEYFCFFFVINSCFFPNLMVGFGSGLGFYLRSPAIVFHSLCDLRLWSQSDSKCSVL